MLAAALLRSTGCAELFWILRAACRMSCGHPGTRSNPLLSQGIPWLHEPSLWGCCQTVHPMSRAWSSLSPLPPWDPCQTLTVHLAIVFRVALVIVAPVVAVDLEDAIVKAAICVFIHLCYVEITLYESQAQPLEQGEEGFQRGWPSWGRRKMEEKGMRNQKKRTRAERLDGAGRPETSISFSSHFSVHSASHPSVQPLTHPSVHPSFLHLMITDCVPETVQSPERDI